MWCADVILKIPRTPDLLRSKTGACEHTASPTRANYSHACFTPLRCVWAWYKPGLVQNRINVVDDLLHGACCGTFCHQRGSDKSCRHCTFSPHLVISTCDVRVCVCVCVCVVRGVGWRYLRGRTRARVLTTLRWVLRTQEWCTFGGFYAHYKW